MVPATLSGFPKVSAWYHGAGAEGDVTALFIINKRFEIH
jgi:hypothetical protein